MTTVATDPTPEPQLPTALHYLVAPHRVPSMVFVSTLLHGRRLGPSVAMPRKTWELYHTALVMSAWKVTEPTVRAEEETPVDATTTTTEA